MLPFYSHGYSLLCGLHKDTWLLLDTTLTAAKAAPMEQKDSSPASESNRRSRPSSINREDEKLTDGHEEYDEKEAEQKDEYDCVIS